MNPDLMALDPREFDLFMAGMLSGFLSGIDRGRELEAAEMAASWRHAYEHVQAVAKIPTHDELEKRRRTYREHPAGAPFREEVAG